MSTRPRTRFFPRLLLVAWGVAAVGIPCSLDKISRDIAKGGIERILAHRARGRATIGRVTLASAFSVRLERARLTLPGAAARRISVGTFRVSLAPASVLRLTPRVERVTLRGGDIYWDDPDPVGSLRRFLARLRTRAPSGGLPRNRSGGRVTLSASFDRVVLVHRGARGSSWRGVTLHRLRAHRDRTGAHGGSLKEGTVQIGAGRGIRIAGAAWQGRGRPGGGLRLGRARLASLQVLCRGGTSCGPRLGLHVDELAPDLLQVRLTGNSLATSGGRMSGNVDLRRKALQGSGRVRGLRLASLQRWMGPILGHRWRSLGSRSMLDARITHLRGDLHRVEGEAALRLHGVELQDPRLSGRPVSVGDLAVRASVRVDRGARRLQLRSATVTRAGVTVRLRGRIQRRGSTLRGEGTLTLAPTPCQRALDAVPRGMAPELRGMRLAGTLSGEISVSALASRLEDLKVHLRVPANLCRVVSDPPRADVAALGHPFAFVSRPPGWKPTRIQMGPAGAGWVSYAQIGRNVVAAFLAAEDRRFFSHHGFDLENIRRALVADLRQGRFVKGASSISQQVVKNVFLSHRRTLARKLEEAVLTWRLERVLSKRRILEIYLNLVEMGPGLFGVRAGAWHYFRKAPSQLNPLEAAHLAAVTPNPRGYHERFRSGRAGMDWLLHLRWLLYQMYAIGWLDRSTYERYRVRDLRLITDPSWRRSSRRGQPILARARRRRSAPSSSGPAHNRPGSRAVPPRRSASVGARSSATTRRALAGREEP